MQEKMSSDFYRILNGELLRCLSMIVKELQRYRMFACLPEPLLEIREMHHQWGCFEKGDGICMIALSKELVMKHSWSAIEDVLRHEMAHYMREYLYPGLDEPSHGEMFRKMCGLIGANPRASGVFPALDDLLAQDDSVASEDASPVMRKIRKLMALSESPNENEARLALLKARELMAKYDVEDAGSDEDGDPFVTVKVKEMYSQMPREENALVCLLEEFYEIKCIIVPADCTMTGGDSDIWRRTYELSGKCSKVKVALYVRDYIRRYIEECWKHALELKICRPGVRNRRDYALGVLHGIRQTLQAQRFDVPQQQALVLRSKALDEYYHGRYPHIRAGRGKSILTNEAAKVAGEYDGRRMTLHDGVEAPSDCRRLKS